MMRKTVGVFALALAVCLVLAACGNAGGSSKAQASSQAAGSSSTQESLVKEAAMRSDGTISNQGSNVANSEQDAHTWANGESGAGTAAESTVEMRVNGTTLTMQLADTAAASALAASLRDAPIAVNMHSYGGFEKVGTLPNALPSNDERITAEPGDVMLYQGNQITVFHGSNTWAYTPLGHIDGATSESLLEAFGDDDVTIELCLTDK